MRKPPKLLGLKIIADILFGLGFLYELLRLHNPVWVVGGDIFAALLLVMYGGSFLRLSKGAEYSAVVGAFLGGWVGSGVSARYLYNLQLAHCIGWGALFGAFVGVTLYIHFTGDSILDRK